MKKLITRTLSLFLSAILLISPLTLGIEVNAEEPVIKKGTTTASILFVRSGAGSNYRRVGGLKRGTAVEILDEQGNWYKIDSGWISSEYVKLVESKPTETPTVEAFGNATVTASLLFVRKDPSTNYSAIGMLKKGDRIQVLESNGNWLKIEAGWVYSAHVKMDNGSSVYTEKKTAVVTANQLNVRSAPSTTAEKTGTLQKNQSVEVLETSGEWIRTGYGWINKNFVKVLDSTNKQNTGVVKAMALNVRKGPGTNYDRVATLRLGEKVTILENQGEWLRVSSGWVKSSYIETLK